MANIISSSAISRRNYWVSEIKKLSGNFINDTEKMVAELGAELKKMVRMLLLIT